MLFWKKRRPKDDEGDEHENEKPVRRIFGFQCSPAIHLNAKALAKELYVDLYVVAEHSIELGLTEIATSMKDPEELEMLRKHLYEQHTIKNLVESVSNYDAEAAGYIREGQIRQHHKEKALRDLVELCDRSRLDPQLIIEIVLQELQRRTEIMRRRAAQKG